MFRSREAVVDFLDGMLAHKFFHRARKVPIQDSELRKKKDKKAGGESATEDDKKKEKERGTDAESSVVESKDKDVR